MSFENNEVINKGFYDCVIYKCPPDTQAHNNGYRFEVHLSCGGIMRFTASKRMMFVLDVHDLKCIPADEFQNKYSQVLNQD